MSNTVFPTYETQDSISSISHQQAVTEHRNQSNNRKGTYIIADVLAMDNSTVGAATRLFCGFFLKYRYRNIYIRTVRNSTLLKIYSTPWLIIWWWR
jgi:predicted transcriptional regulator